ncbi:MAG: ribosome-associated translation inhibitor RaiA [Nitrospirota bacterium]|jgi:putative sigma-54 modulation protein
MNIVVNGRNVDVTPALRKYAEEKIGKFERYLSNITEAVVTLSIQKYMHKAEVLIKANGILLQAEGVTEELYSSIDEVSDKLDKQVKKLKEKLKDRRRAENVGRVEASSAAAAVQAATPPETGVIIERRQFATKPMAPDEAALELDGAERSFFVFTNSESGDVNVIYKRGDGNFGLIEPVHK